MTRSDHHVDALLDGFAALDSSAVSDALDALGLPSGLGGFQPQWGHPTIVGLAATVQLEPARPGPSGAHIATTAIATSGPRHVIVVANQGRTDVSCWGGLLSLGATLNGVRGVVADGACRDVGEAREHGFPVYSKGCVPATARGRLQQRSTGEPVVIDGVTVSQGDIVLADETGVVFVPSDSAQAVLRHAADVAERERAIADDLRAGIPLPRAMRDARLAGTEQGGS